MPQPAFSGEAAGGGGAGAATSLQARRNVELCLLSTPQPPCPSAQGTGTGKESWEPQESTAEAIPFARTKSRCHSRAKRFLVGVKRSRIVHSFPFSSDMPARFKPNGKAAYCRAT